MINTQFLGLPLFQSSDSQMLQNIFKEKVLQLEDKVYYTEQNLFNCLNIKKLFMNLAQIMRIKIGKMGEKNYLQTETPEKLNKNILPDLTENGDEKSKQRKIYDFKFLLDTFQKTENFCGLNEISKNEKEENLEIKEPKKVPSEVIKNKSNKKIPKLKNKKFQNKIKFRKLLTGIQKKDLLFQLNKIKHFEKQFTVFNFLNKQSDLNLEDLNIHYQIQNLFSKTEEILTNEINLEIPKETVKGKNLKFIVKSDSEPVFEKEKNQTNHSILNLNSSRNSEKLYKILEKKINSDLSNLEFNVKIILNQAQENAIRGYVQTNLQILDKRIKHLTQLKKFKNKQKRRITEHAVDFFYDQKMVNRLNENLEKIKDPQIENIFRILEIGGNEGSEVVNEERSMGKCLEYNLSSPFCLRLVTSRSADALSQQLK